MVVGACGCASGQTRLKSSTGEPLHLLAILDEQGKKVGDFYMTGDEMTLDGRQRPIDGAGFLQAVPNEYVTVLILCNDENPDTSKRKSKQLALRAGRIEWDRAGKTLSVARVKSVVESSLVEAFQLVPADPKVKPRDVLPEIRVVQDGGMPVTVRGLGDFVLDVKFGDRGSFRKNRKAFFRSVPGATSDSRPRRKPGVNGR